MSLRRLLSIVVKELRQLRRDRLTFAMIIGIPTMQLLLFGFAINLDVRHLDAAVLDQAQTARSRELVADLGATDVLTLRQSLSAGVRNTVRAEIDKDYVKMPVYEIEKHLAG